MYVCVCVYVCIQGNFQAHKKCNNICKNEMEMPMHRTEQEKRKLAFSHHCQNVCSRCTAKTQCTGVYLILNANWTATGKRNGNALFSFRLVL